MQDVLFVFWTIFFLVCIVSFVVVMWFIWPSIIGAPWEPTPRGTVRKMLELAQVSQEDTVMDLGSGDGRIIVMAGREYGARSIGIEADPIRVLWSRMVIRFRNLEGKVKVIWGNFFHQNLADATVLTIFQLPGVNNRIKDKLTSELKPGTRVVSYTHQFDGWTPVKTTRDPNLFLYEI